MAKSLYSALFDWIVLRINHALLNKRDVEEAISVSVPRAARRGRFSGERWPACGEGSGLQPWDPLKTKTKESPC